MPPKPSKNTKMLCKRLKKEKKSVDSRSTVCYNKSRRSEKDGQYARVLESADRHVWGACVNDVWVQVPSLAPEKKTPFVCGQKVFSFQRNKSLRICEIRCACEILRCNVKCLRAWVDLFHFTWCTASNFTMTAGHYFTSEGYFTFMMLSIMI